MTRSRSNRVRLLALLWCLIATGGVTWAQTTLSTHSATADSSSTLTRSTLLLAQVSDTESKPLAPTRPANPTEPIQAKPPIDPLVEAATRFASEDAKRESELAAKRQPAISISGSESKPLPMYLPPQSKPTENEVRSKEMLLANPSERKPLGTPGKGMVPDSDPENENQKLGEFSNSGSWVLNTITALGVVISLIFAMRLVMNKLSGRAVMGGRTGIVEVLSRTSISPRNQIMLLRLGQRIIVVSEGPNGVRTLANLDDPDEVAGLLTTINSSKPGSITQSFNQLLNRADTEMDNPAGFTAEHGGDEDEHLVDKTRNELSSLLSRIRSMSKGGRDA